MRAPPAASSTSTTSRRTRATGSSRSRPTYRGYEVLQLPPNGQGIAVLLMLDLLAGFDLAAFGHGTPECLHLMIEAKKLAYADLHRHVADPEHARGPGRGAAVAGARGGAARRDRSRSSGPERRTGIARARPRGAARLADEIAATPGDTVYLTAIDGDGNAASFINSLYDGFGSEIVGGRTGIALHSRGSGFVLERGHPNEYAPGKRPFHTIIPGMVRRDGRLHLSYGVMGGAFQPQGHVQLLTGLIDFGLTPQEAIDAPRWRHDRGPRGAARARHAARHRRRAGRSAATRSSPPRASRFGGAQAILVDPATGTFVGASDPRKDGCALGY